MNTPPSVRRLNPWQFAAMGLVLLPATAAACSLCVFALTEAILPPTQPWCVIGVAWFVVAWALLEPTAAPCLVPGRWWEALAYLFAAVFLGGSLFGPLPFLALLAFSVSATIRVARSTSPPKQRIRARGLLAIGLVALSVTGVHSWYTLSRLDEVGWILRWSGTTPNRGRLRHLRERHDLDSLRRLVRSGDLFEASQAAEILGDIGEPGVDVGLLESTLAALPKNTWPGDYYVKALEKLRQRAPVSPAAGS